MTENIAPQRSETVYSEAAFVKTLKVLDRQPWLARKHAELKQLHQICNSDDAKLKLVLDLLFRFKYLQSKDRSSCIEKIVKRIVSVWKLSPSDTIIVGKDFEDRSPDSSEAVAYLVQPIFAKFPGWTKNNFTTHTRDALKNTNFKNIVLIDDFSGSGSSVIEFLDWIQGFSKQHNLQPKNIYTCFFSAMIKTRTVVKPRLGNRLYSVHWLRRGISDYDANSAHKRRQIMRGIEKSLDGLNAKFSLGFDASEALYACEEFNIPNNNFPIFWYDKYRKEGYRKPLFRRLRSR